MATGGNKIMQDRETHVLTLAVCFPDTVIGSVIGLHQRCTGRLLSLTSTTALCYYRQPVLLQSSRTPCNAKVQSQAECVPIGKLLQKGCYEAAESSRKL
jgi:hypothetical protein